ncbi:hypothetical protein KCU85_g5315, partial [Aureobasidium melanogenum]
MHYNQSLRCDMIHAHLSWYWEDHSLGSLQEEQQQQQQQQHGDKSRLYMQAEPVVSTRRGLHSTAPCDEEAETLRVFVPPSGRFSATAP